MRSVYANGVALWGVLMGMWFALAAASQGGLDAHGGVLTGASVSLVATLFSGRLGLLGGDAWPDRAGLAGKMLLRRARLAFEGIALTLRALAGDARSYRPALVRYAMDQANPARGIFALLASAAPGLMSVSLDARGLYLHVLHEDDGDDEDLRGLEGASRPAEPK